MLRRLRQGDPILPREPRRPVPWRAGHVLLVIALYAALAALMGSQAELFLGPEAVREPVIRDVEKTDTVHTIARLLIEGSPWVRLMCVFIAAVVAPIAEEFLFRVLLQGWLEALQRRLRPKMPVLRRWVPGAIGPVVLASFLFAMMHFRVARPIRHPDYEVYLMVGTGLISALTVVFAVVILWARAGATAEDLGWSPERLLSDIRLGLTAFAGLAGPIYVATVGLGLLLPRFIAPDPFVLFLFALALGTLYHRTHRIAPAIVLHMALNITSLAMVLPLIWK